MHPSLRRAAFSSALVAGSVALFLAAAAIASAQDPSVSPASDTASPAPTAELVSPGPSPDAGSSPGPSATPVPMKIPLELVAPTPTAEPLIPGPTAPPPIKHPSDGKSNACFDCHSSINAKQAAIADAWQASIHGQNGVSCADCHGGDPTSDRMGTAMDPAAGFIGKPNRVTTIGICGSCHSDPTVMKQYGLPTDQYAKYWTSVHGQQLLAHSDTQVAICTDCHGVHDIAKTTDPTSMVYPDHVPDLCSSCHSDAAKMQPYGIPTNQYAIYSQSVHGRALLTDGNLQAPSCASCHGAHDARPPTSDTVVNVCGSCHTTTEDLYKQSRHAELGAAAPKCWTCHGTHDVSTPSSALFFHLSPPNYTCDTCHDLQNRTLRIQIARFANPDDRRCDTCHHQDSDIYAQVKAIDDALSSAQSAYDDAQAKIDQAARAGMLVSDAQVTLSEAKTGLIKAQAAVHTTELTQVAPPAEDAKAKAEAAAAMAQSKLDETVFRREAMVVVVALILMNVLALILVKRILDGRRRGTGGSSP
jgi:hypothetical protein